MKFVTVKILVFSFLLILILIGFLFTAFKIGIFGPLVPVKLERKEITLETTSPLTPSFAPSGLASRFEAQVGCLVCHADPNLKKRVNGQAISFYVNPQVYEKSVHKNIACIDCHSDFSYQAHQMETKPDYRRTAGLSCIRCKDHKKQYYPYLQSIHGHFALSEVTSTVSPAARAPTCGDCHGSHSIKSLKKDKAYRESFFFDGKNICGKSRCHSDKYENYSDYYHGRAYKTKSLDSPACWDCHDYHLVLPRSSPSSTISKKNLAKTCARCHPDASNALLTYVPLIHVTTKAEVPLVNLIGKTLAQFSKTFPKPSPKEEKVSFFQKILRFFFPSSLREKK